MHAWIERPKPADLLSSLVVFVVALPLSIGVALASGASPAAGLLTAISGGILVGLFAGAPLTVSGPAAGLTALVFQLVQEFGIDGLAVITVMAGLFQIAFSLARSGKLFEMIPESVLDGMLFAIGAIITLGQLHVMMGAGVPKSAILALSTMKSTFVTAWSQSHVVVPPVMICGLTSLLAQVLWPKLFPKLTWLPGALVAVVLATIVGSFWEMPRVELSPLIPLAMARTREFLSLSWASSTSLYGFFAASFGVAFVASAESLLTARAIDNLIAKKPGFVPAKLNRELAAQGIGNIFSGITGGLPMTAVIVRSAANINSGAITRWSTVLHGVWIAIFAVSLPFVLTKIPLAALAAVLVVTGTRLLNLKHLSHLVKNNPPDATIQVLTSIAIFATDLLKGLGFGLFVAFVLKWLVPRLRGGRASP